MGPCALVSAGISEGKGRGGEGWAHSTATDADPKDSVVGKETDDYYSERMVVRIPIFVSTNLSLNILQRNIKLS